MNLKQNEKLVYFLTLKKRDEQGHVRFIKHAGVDHYPMSQDAEDLKQQYVKRGIFRSHELEVLGVVLNTKSSTESTFSHN